MNLDALAEAILNPQFIYICLSVYVVTYFVRRLTEGICKILVDSNKVKNTALALRIWSEILLPILPVLVGGLMGLMAKTFIWPEITNGTRSGRIIYGAVCGLFSAFIYNRIRAWIRSSPKKSKIDNSQPSVTE